jgi:hypothetical protein
VLVKVERLARSHSRKAPNLAGKHQTRLKMTANRKHSSLAIKE